MRNGTPENCRFALTALLTYLLLTFILGVFYYSAVHCSGNLWCTQFMLTHSRRHICLIFFLKKYYNASEGKEKKGSGNYRVSSTIYSVLHLEKASEKRISGWGQRFQSLCSEMTKCNTVLKPFHQWNYLCWKHYQNGLRYNNYGNWLKFYILPFSELKCN